MTKDGQRLPGPIDGVPMTQFVFLPATYWQIEDTWHSAGLKGTGSHHVVLRDTMVPVANFADPSSGISCLPGPLYNAPLRIIPLLHAFPLLFWATLELGGVLESPDRSKSRAMVFFSIVFAAAWLSNAPAGVMASYSAALLFAWMAFREKSWKPLVRGAGGVALGFGLAGFYLVPAAYEQRWVNIGQALSSGLLPSQNFLYTVIDDPEHTLFNWIASTTAVVLILLTATGALAARRRDVEGTAPIAENLWRALLLLATLATVMMLRPSSFLWQVLPKLRFVQFPWRWMSILGVPFAYFLAAAVVKQRFRWIWACVVVVVLAGVAAFMCTRRGGIAMT